MNSTRTIRVAVVFFLFLVLSAHSASAVSFIREFSITRLNTAGSSFVVLTRSDTSFCYLSRVFVEETDTGGESAGCRLTRQGFDGSWVLEAVLGRSSDADAFCNAICYTTDTEDLAETNPTEPDPTEPDPTAN